MKGVEIKSTGKNGLEDEVKALRETLSELCEEKQIKAYHTKVYESDGKVSMIVTIPHLAGESESDMAKVAAHIVGMNWLKAFDAAMAADHDAKLDDLLEACRMAAIAYTSDNWHHDYIEAIRDALAAFQGGGGNAD